MNRCGFSLIFTLCLFIVEFCFSQSKLSKSAYYEYYDLSVGAINNSIYNGLEYLDEDRSLNIDNHKFYSSYNFLPGSIVYGKQPFYDLKIKYDLLEDIVVLEFINIKVNHLGLNSSMIESFVIGDDLFVRLPKDETLKPFYGNGFFKVAYKGNSISLYVKHTKTRIEKIRNKKIFSSFKEDMKYFVKNNNIFFEVNKIKEVIKAIPSKENQIRAFYKKNSNLYKRNKNQFLVMLIKSLEV